MLGTMRCGQRGATVAMGVLLIGLLAAAIPARAADPIGAERCGSCHESQYEAWRQSAHARSLEQLTQSQRADPSCRACHTLAPASDDPRLAAVQCESCHGFGSDYAPEPVMRDPQLAELLGLDKGSKNACRSCHENVQARLLPTDQGGLDLSTIHSVGGPSKPPGTP